MKYKHAKPHVVCLRASAAMSVYSIMKARSNERAGETLKKISSWRGPREAKPDPEKEFSLKRPDSRHTGRSPLLAARPQSLLHVCSQGYRDDSRIQFVI